MKLSWTPGTAGLADNMPLWSVVVAPAIMKNHDNFWCPQIIGLIFLLFVDACKQTERLHERPAS